MKQTNSGQSRQIFTILGLGLMAAILGGLLWLFVVKPAGNALPEQLSATVLPKGKPITGLNLTDHDGKRFSEEQFKGKWNFLFFGFTNCPDVCPTTMLVIKSVWSKLPKTAFEAPAPQMYFISVDPQRDKPEKLREYVQYYHPDFVGITGNHNELDVLVNQVGALYGYEDGDKEGEYTVNHSSQIILVDPNGNMRAVFTTPHRVNEIVDTFLAIKKYFE